MKIEYITDWETIYSDDFQKQWLEWVEKAENSHVFFHPALCMAWLETYRPLRNLEPLFCIGRSENQIIFLPLVLWKRNWKNAFQKLLVPVGYSDFDYHDPLMIDLKTDSNKKESQKQYFKSLLDKVTKEIKFDELRLDGMHNENLSNLRNISSEACPFIQLSDFESFESFKNTLPNKILKEIVRRKRRLNEQGAVVEVVFDSENLNNALNELPLMLKLHAERWPNAYKAPRFHENLITYGLKNNIVHFSKITSGNNAVSWRLGFIWKEKYYSYMPTINEDYSKFAPGKQHLLFCIEEAIKNNCAVYDQLRGNEMYKSEWTQNHNFIYNYSFITKNPITTIKNRLLKIKSKL